MFISVETSGYLTALRPVPFGLKMSHMAQESKGPLLTSLVAPFSFDYQHLSLRCHSSFPCLTGLPTKLPDIMLVGSQSFSPGGPNGIIRSQSFAGFSGLQERRSRQVLSVPETVAGGEWGLGAYGIISPPHTHTCCAISEKHNPSTKMKELSFLSFRISHVEKVAEGLG